MATAVNERSATVSKLAEAWAITEPLMGGTAAMREAGLALLPRFPSESPESWLVRLKQSVLFPAFRRTAMVMAGKPFSKPLTLQADTPAEIEGWAEDIDAQGVNLHTFASEMMIEVLAYGLAGILVEAPKAPGLGPISRAEQQALGLRPYWVRIKHDQILGWRSERIGGRVRLTQLRLLECAEVDDGAYGVAVVERVRVLMPGAWELWEKRYSDAGRQSTWVMVDSGTTSINEIAFVPLYGFRDGFMCGSSPLQDLAHMNVKHWQRQSDLDTIEHCACVPILHAAGFGDTEQIVFGASTAIKSANPDASVQWVELKGNSIGETKQSIQALEAQMIQAGAELLVKMPGARTATESANDAEANKSDLQRIVEGFEDSLNLALYYTSRYAGLTGYGRVELFKGFGATVQSDASSQLVLSLQQGGLISKATAIAELQRRGMLADGIDADDELERVATEGDALGEIEEPEEPEEEAPDDEGEEPLESETEAE